MKNFRINKWFIWSRGARNDFKWCMFVKKRRQCSREQSGIRFQIRGRNAVKRRGKNISQKRCGIDGLDSTNLFFDSRRSIKSRNIYNEMNGIVISKWMDAKIDIRHQCRYATCDEEI